jgi:hypothetical protein
VVVCYVFSWSLRMSRSCDVVPVRVAIRREGVHSKGLGTIKRESWSRKILDFRNPNETESRGSQPPFVNTDNKFASRIFDGRGSLSIAPYRTTPHTQRSCSYSRAARTTDLLSSSTQPLTVFGLVHIQMTHSENTHMYGRAYPRQHSVRERAEQWLSLPVIRVDLALAPACERPYTEVEVLTISMVDPSAGGWVCRYLGGVQDYLTRGFAAAPPGQL